MVMFQKARTFCQENRILIASFILIGSTHWMWLKLQDNPKLVPPAERKGLPIVEGFKKLSEIVVEKYEGYFPDPSKRTK